MVMLSAGKMFAITLVSAENGSLSQRKLKSPSLMYR